MPVIYGAIPFALTKETIVELVAGEDITYGSLVTIKNNKVFIADNTTLSRLPCFGIAYETKNINEIIKILISGSFSSPLRDSDFSSGSFVFVSQNGKATTQPPQSPNYAQIIGIAINNTDLVLQVDYSLVKLS